MTDPWVNGIMGSYRQGYPPIARFPPPEIAGLRIMKGMIVTNPSIRPDFFALGGFILRVVMTLHRKFLPGSSE